MSIQKKYVHLGRYAWSTYLIDVVGFPLLDPSPLPIGWERRFTKDEELKNASSCFHPREIYTSSLT